MHNHPTHASIYRYPAADRRAFTILEILMALLILSLLSALVLGISRHAKETAQRAKALADLGEIHNALSSYFAAHNTYPLPEKNKDSLDPKAVPLENIWLEPPAWAPDDAQHSSGTRTNRWHLRYYLPHDFDGLDPWRNYYRYYHTTNNPLSYRVFSMGSTTNDPSKAIMLENQ